jgi:NTP pyrophosphatase (non-canonical NTP hydrolase)
MQKITDIVRAYYDFRGLTVPDDSQALLFLVSEVGELADAHVEQMAEWIRNNANKERSVEDEVGDILMMLTAYCLSRGIDPLDCMLSKFTKKGFPAPDMS